MHTHTHTHKGTYADAQAHHRQALLLPYTVLPTANLIQEKLSKKQQDKIITKQNVNTEVPFGHLELVFYDFLRIMCPCKASLQVVATFVESDPAYFPAASSSRKFHFFHS